MSDGIRVGVVWQRLSSQRLIKWANFRAEVINVRRAQQIVSTSAQPMDVGACDPLNTVEGRRVFDSW